jgi:hypothetical protein
MEITIPNKYRTSYYILVLPKEGEVKVRMTDDNRSNSISGNQSNQSQQLVRRIWFSSVILTLCWISISCSSSATQYEHSRNHDYNFGWLPQQISENYDSLPVIQNRLQKVKENAPIQLPGIQKKIPDQYLNNLNGTLAFKRSALSDSTNCSGILPNVSLVPLRMTEFRFMHVGKAGGGYVSDLSFCDSDSLLNDDNTY